MHAHTDTHAYTTQTNIQIYMLQNTKLKPESKI